MISAGAEPPPGAHAIRTAFDAAGEYTLGLEEELMLLDPGTLDLAPVAGRLLERLEGDRRFKPELPASQLEIVTAPCRTVAEAAGELARGRRDLAAAAGGEVRLAAAGTHPFAEPEGELNTGRRYDRTAAEFGVRARRQLVFALQVHVAPGESERALGVYNALRSYLPEIAALAANAPFHGGADSGLASVRPTISEQLTRQGVPPPLASWDEYAGALEWGAAAGAVPEPNAWWWELRPHPAFGTLELRVPDAQTTISEATAVAAFCQCLVASLGERHDAGELPPDAPTWRIEENRWWAARDGLDARLADLQTGERRPARVRLLELLGELMPAAARLGCEGELASVEQLIDANGAIRQREVAGQRGTYGLTGWLTDRWLVA